jgi:hypothetical protein
MPDRMIHTPVKTRFVCVVTTMAMMLEYRSVVNYCYSGLPTAALRQRNPDARTWEVATLIVDTLKPNMEACVLNQRRDFWLLSDAVGFVVRF